ncbi:hypothetical protein I4U23_010242 [Adineta vaga]|nr:hypothetical protein I4U23_010242 [Adineta vaga]
MLKIYLIIFTILPLISLILSNPASNDNSFGCGPMGLNGDLILNATDRAEIIPCCVAHDTCYRNCSKSRAACDCEFYACIKNRCENHLPYDCGAFAVKFFTLVRIGGIASYQRDQRSNQCSRPYFGEEFPTRENIRQLLDACFKN